MMSRLFTVIAFSILFAATTTGHAIAADKKEAACAFDANNIVLNNVIKLYSCVPIADALCARTCGDTSISTAINTTINKTQIGKTTVLCRDDKADAHNPPVKHEVSVDGLIDTLFVHCNAPADK